MAMKYMEENTKALKSIWRGLAKVEGNAIEEQGRAVLYMKLIRNTWNSRKICLKSSRMLIRCSKWTYQIQS